MPLLDHFHPPLANRRHWHSFHNAWATYLAEDLNRRLPPGYFAESNVQFGIEIDVAAQRDGTPGNWLDPANDFEMSVWTCPAPAAVIDFPFLTDIVEVCVFSDAAGPVLAGAIELVSPSNKDRPESRSSFVAKCRSYLQQGVGLVIVDTVTSYRANLHRDLLTELDHDESGATPSAIYVSAFRVVAADTTRLQIWNETLQLAQPLPTLPLWLSGDLCLPIELEATYQQTCAKQRVANIGA